MEGMCKRLLERSYWKFIELEVEVKEFEMTGDGGLKCYNVEEVLRGLRREWRRVVGEVTGEGFEVRLSDLPVKEECREMILTGYFVEEVKRRIEGGWEEFESWLREEVKEERAMPMIVSSFKRFKMKDNGRRREEIVRWGWEEGVIEEGRG